MFSKTRHPKTNRFFVLVCIIIFIYVEGHTAYPVYCGLITGPRHVFVPHPRHENVAMAFAVERGQNGGKTRETTLSPLTLQPRVRSLVVVVVVVVSLALSSW